jgi:hypothetical protein
MTRHPDSYQDHPQPPEPGTFAHNAEGWTIPDDQPETREAWAARVAAMREPQTLDLDADPMALSNLMEFDHPIQVHDDGTVSDRVEGVYAPTLEGVSDGTTETIDGWELVTAGYTGQDRYNGPIMHNSEQIGGRLAEDILARPGVYVALVCAWPDDEESTDDGELYMEGWAVARLNDEPTPDPLDAIADGLAEGNAPDPVAADEYLRTTEGQS